MKKITSYLLLLFASVMMGQTPMFFNTNVVGGQNSIPLSSGATLTWRKGQFFIPTGSLGAVAPGNNITKIYFQAGSSATVTYPDLYVRLKTGIGTGFTAAATGPFETGLTTVFHGVNFAMTTVSGNWYAITLQTPFLFDPTKPLYVEIEHNSPNAAGPTVCQNAVIPGPGNGRAWGDYAAVNNTGVGTNQLNFGIDVIPATPCTGVPPANSTSPATFSTCANITNPLLGLTSTYSLGGLTYAWQTSTSSPVGPYTPVSGTLSSIQIPTLGVTTWYQAVVTCTNPGGGTASLTPTQFLLGGSVVSTVPYNESFEGVQTINRLPNCSWSASNMGATCLTYTSSNTMGRTPNTGTNFASFYYTPSGISYFYTNGIQLNAGVTYKASLWFQTESVGYTNWTDLSILYGSNQTPTGLVSIVSTNGPAVSNVYKQLTGNFTVPTSGLYYVAVRATASNGSANYLSWDDISVTVPCSINSPTVSLITNTTSVCANTPVNLSATGANTYSWNTGATTANITDMPLVNTNYYVIGTSSLSGCSTTVTQMVTVNPSPAVYIYATKSDVCSGQPTNLNAIGSQGSTYAWSNNTNGANITVNPTSNATYTVLATNAYGCIGMATQAISVHTLPTITAPPANDICVGETQVLSASGAVNYTWVTNNTGTLLQGNPINVNPITSTIYSVTGVDAFGCAGKQTVALNVNECTGLANNKLTGLSIYPNPTSGEIVIELNNSSEKTIQVMDLTGRIISSSTSSLEIVKVDLTNLSNGIYYVKIQSDSTIEVVKVVKQ